MSSAIFHLTFAALRSKELLPILALGLTLIQPLWAQAEPVAIQTFELAEHFGVAHPDQVVKFGLKQPVDERKVHLVDERGEPTLFQIDASGQHLLVQTDLPIGAARRWELRAGASPERLRGSIDISRKTTPAGPVHEVTNGLTGFRLPLPVKGPSLLYPPFVESRYFQRHSRNKPMLWLPAPVQGIRMRDGTWGCQPPVGMAVRASRLHDMKVEFLERGPLRVRAEVTYILDSPADGDTPAVERGKLRVEVELEAGQASVLIDQISEFDVLWGLDFYDAVQPDRVRSFRGTANVDQRIIDEEVRYESAASTGMSYHRRGVVPVDWWRTGQLVQLYRSDADDDANVVGVFRGKMSRAERVTPFTGGAGIFWTERSEGVEVTRTRGRQAITPLNRASAGVDVRHLFGGQALQDTGTAGTRFQWGIFVGTKGEALAEPPRYPPICQQMNALAGINLTKLHKLTLNFDDPPQGYGAMYMPQLSRQAMLEVDELSNTGEYAMFTDDTGQQKQRMYDRITSDAQKMVQAFVHESGVFDFAWHYMHADLRLAQHLPRIDLLLSHPDLSEDERTKLKAAAVLYAAVLWDDDHVPIKLAGGTYNMSHQHANCRYGYAMLLSRHPEFAARAAQIAQDFPAETRDLFTPEGAPRGGSGYLAATLAPTLNTMQQIKQISAQDPFEQMEKWDDFGNFMMHLHTPPDPRVGGRRVLAPLGDCATQPTAVTGQLGTALRDIAPQLSRELLWMWQQGGKAHDTMFGTTTLKINSELPTQPPELGDASFPKYMSVLRHGWNTPSESALWMIDGEWYADHRNSDAGSLILYALGAPILYKWDAIYTPHVSGSFYHNTLTLERTLRGPWDQEGANSPGSGAIWPGGRNEAFLSFPEGAYSRAYFSGSRDPGQAPYPWKREVLSYRGEAEQPFYFIRDSLGTFQASKANVSSESESTTENPESEYVIATWNFMSTGTVQTENGSITPKQNVHPSAKHDPKNPAHLLPSSSSAIPLASGVHRLTFTGQHEVDWDVYLICNEPQEATLGAWAMPGHDGLGLRSPEHKLTSQQILHVRGREGFQTLIIPYRRGQRPDNLAVVSEGTSVQVTIGDHKVQITPEGYVSQSPTGAVERSFGQ